MCPVNGLSYLSTVRSISKNIIVNCLLLVAYSLTRTGVVGEIIIDIETSKHTNRIRDITLRRAMIKSKPWNILIGTSYLTFMLDILINLTKLSKHFSYACFASIEYRRFITVINLFINNLFFSEMVFNLTNRLQFVQLCVVSENMLFCT